MAEADWTLLTSSLSTGTVDRGVTAGIPRPNGGGSFIYGFNSLDTTPGVVGLFANMVDFAPMAKGGSIRGAVQRGLSGGATGFAPFLFIGLTGATIGDIGYMLGLENADPHRIMLRKGILTGGLPETAVTTPPTSGVLARSTDTYEVGGWHHLRLDMIVNLNGDVVLNAYKSDLLAHAVSSPVWTAIPGIDQFIDDAIQVNTGTAPLTSGRAGFGIQTADVTRRCYFDHIEVFRQT